MSNKLKILDFIGNRYELDIDENDSVKNIKIKIRDLGGPHPVSQKILYRGVELMNDEKIEQYINVDFNKTNIKHMMLDQDILTRFKVRLENGKIIDVDYNIKKEGNSILDFKVRLLRILHVIVSNMVLSINGKILDNNEKVTYIDIPNNLIELQIKNKVM